MEVKIILADSTEIRAEQNGDCFIVDKKIEFEAEQLETVTIQADGEEKVLNDVEVMDCASVDGRYWFAFREIPAAEEEAQQLRADVDYLLAIAE